MSSAPVDRPQVSVVISTFRRPEMLAESLNSVLGGTFTDIEVLIGNDGAPEDLAELRSRVDDPRVIWLDRPQSLGMLRNNVDGFARARGEFVANLHDDDRWTSRFLSTLVPPMQADPDIVLAFCDHLVMDGSGLVLEADTEKTTDTWGRRDLAPGKHQPFFELGLYRQSISFGCSSVFRRSAMPLDQFPDEIGPAYDVWATYLLASTGGAAWYEPERLTFYRSHPASQTGSGRRTNAHAQVHLNRSLLADDRLNPWHPTFRQRLAAAYRTVGLEALRDADIAAARRALRSAVVADPSARNIAIAAAARVAPGATQRLAERRATRLTGL